MAKQLNFANRRPRPLGLRGKERIAFSSLPSRADIEEVLTTLTANITLKQEDLPRRQLELTPTINNYYDSGKGLFYEELLNIDLLEEDMLTDKPRTASLTKLCRALSIGHYTALGNAPPLQFKTWSHIIPLNYDNASLPHGEPHHVAVSNTPIFIMKSQSTREETRDVTGKKGYLIIPAKHHANSCLCAADYANNNIESLHFLRACVPQDMHVEYEENDEIPDGPTALHLQKKYTNYNHVYVGSVSSCGTVTPYLTCRQPITEILRSTPANRQPQFAHIDLKYDMNLYRAVNACRYRPEVRLYTKNFNTSCANKKKRTSNKDLFRFPALNRDIQNVDILALNPAYPSLDHALANEPLIEPFRGPQACSYCPSTIDVSEPQHYLMHLLDQHAIIAEVDFTCPGCIGILIFNKSTFPAHFTQIHAGTMSLMNIFTETHTHVRTQHVLAMSMFIAITSKLDPILTEKLIEDIPTSKPHFASSLGGYSYDANALATDVAEAQQALMQYEVLDLTGAIPDRKPIEIFDLQRPSSPITLQPRSQREPSYAQVTKGDTGDSKNSARKRPAADNSPIRFRTRSPSPASSCQSPPRRMSSRRSPSTRRRRSITPERPRTRQATNLSYASHDWHEVRPRRSRTSDSNRNNNRRRNYSPSRSEEEEARMSPESRHRNEFYRAYA